MKSRLVPTNNEASVDDSGYEAENCEHNIDDQVGSASFFHPNTNWWEKKSTDEFRDIGAGNWHVGLLVSRAGILLKN